MSEFKFTSRKKTSQTPHYPLEKLEKPENEELFKFFKLKVGHPQKFFSPEGETSQAVKPPAAAGEEQPQDLTAWAENLITKYGRISLVMDNYAVLGVRDPETLAFHRETSETMGEYGEVHVKGVTVETWGENPQSESGSA